MKIETTPREDHQMEMVVELETTQMESAKRRAARKISEKAKIPGFRPGKAPYDIVLRYYGEANITEEAVEILINENYTKALEEAGIRPAAAGSLENIESTNPPKFKFVVPLQPVVELGDYKSVRKDYDWQAPSEAELEETINNLRGMYSRPEPVERESIAGDFVTVDVIGTKVGAAVDEEPAFDRNSYPIVAGKDEKESEWPIPGFSMKMVNVKAGDTLEFDYTFSSDAEDETLRDQTFKFTVIVKTVRSSSLPELDDAFAQKTGLGQTVEEFRQRMRENIDEESRNKYDDEYFEELIDMIKAGATVKYPSQVLEHETEHVIEDLKRRLEQQNTEFDTYLKMRNTTLEKFTEEAKPVARKRLERGLIIDQISRAEEIKLDEEALRQEFSKTWTEMAMYDPDFSKVTKGGTQVSNELVDAVAMNTANRMMTRSVLDRIKAIATGTYVAAETVEEPKAEEVVEDAAPAAEEAPAAAKPKARKSKKSEQAAE